MSRTSSAIDRASATHAGQAVYTPWTLAIYDTLVLGLSNRFIWRCPTPRILALYNRHVTAEHLDVGVGTGWYLDHCRFPVARPRIGLLDLNASSLAAASARIARYAPTTFQVDVLKPIEIDVAPFASASLSYLLHCMPGSIAEKADALDHVCALLRPDAVVFGATLLSGGVPHSAAARRLMRAYNRKGIFANERDDLAGLRAALTMRVEMVELELVGCGALFVARGPKRR